MATTDPLFASPLLKTRILVVTEAGFPCTARQKSHIPGACQRETQTRRGGKVGTDAQGGRGNVARRHLFPFGESEGDKIVLTNEGSGGLEAERGRGWCIVSGRGLGAAAPLSGPAEQRRTVRYE
ncbi:hypothetical protein TNCV_2558721 [Trichonephila clavipes]|nr:hypothetical protein TNCV_2558721 [Trichonephila clavipes]